MEEKTAKKAKKSAISMTLQISPVFNLGPIISLILFSITKMYPEIDIRVWVCLTPTFVHIGALLLLCILADWVSSRK